MALVTSVLGTSAAQQQLVPALMRVYGQADFVVGLDVDKDDYDKFSVGCHSNSCQRGYHMRRTDSNSIEETFGRVNPVSESCTYLSDSV
jgi:hypothetical protein